MDGCGRGVRRRGVLASPTGPARARPPARPGAQVGPPAATWAYSAAKYRTYPLFLGAAAVMLVPPILLLAAARARAAPPPPAAGEGAGGCGGRFPAKAFGAAEDFEAERLLDPAQDAP